MQRLKSYTVFLVAQVSLHDSLYTPVAPMPLVRGITSVAPFN